MTQCARPSGPEACTESTDLFRRGFSRGGIWFITCAAVAVSAAYHLLQQPPRRVGFASGCQAFGHRELLGVLESFGLVREPTVTVER